MKVWDTKDPGHPKVHQFIGLRIHHVAVSSGNVVATVGYEGG